MLIALSLLSCTSIPASASMPVEEGPWLIQTSGGQILATSAAVCPNQLTDPGNVAFKRCADGTGVESYSWEEFLQVDSKKFYWPNSSLSERKWKISIGSGTVANAQWKKLLVSIPAGDNPYFSQAEHHRPTNPLQAPGTAALSGDYFGNGIESYFSVVMKAGATTSTAWFHVMFNGNIATEEWCAAEGFQWPAGGATPRSWEISWEASKTATGWDKPFGSSWSVPSCSSKLYHYQHTYK
jgi:hypothetical protein